MLYTVVGARPQFVKAAVLSKALQDRGIPEQLVHTGQHYDYGMSEVFWKELGLPTNVINLEVGSGTHGKQTAAIITRLEHAILNSSDHIEAMILYGDTNSTLAGAIVAAKLHMPVIHVEAGLRSFNWRMPEEINRVVTDRLSQILFCSSQIGVTNLAKEGIVEGVYQVGDIMKDAVFRFGEVERSGNGMVPDHPFHLLTLHRPYNTDDLDTINGIMRALAEIGETFIWPVHPRVANKQGVVVPANVKQIDPVGYLDMLQLIKASAKILTDSGGLQKEAYWLQKPTLTLRKETEWIETLERGCNKLVGNNQQEIVSNFHDHEEGQWDPNLYGDGKSAQRMAEIIKTFLESC